MPRQPRLDAPGLLQHVIVRGVNRADIFLDDDDRRQFISRLSRLLVETESECFAWVLLPNHAHLLLRCNRIELARFMRRLLTGYAVAFNRRHDRVGHLFQNRYKSIVCEEDTYLLELIRYIHLNPLRAGLVNDLAGLESFPWCGHKGLLGHGALAGQVVDPVLVLFAGNVAQARSCYRQFLADGVALGRRPVLVGEGVGRPPGPDGHPPDVNACDSRVLGSDAFVEKMFDKQREGRRQSNILNLDDLLARVAGFFALQKEELCRRGRRNRQADARELLCFLAVRELRYSGVKVAEKLKMGVPSVSRAVGRGERLVATRPEVRSWWEDQITQ